MNICLTTGLNACQVETLYKLTLTIIPCGSGNHCHFHCTQEETEAKRDFIVCLTLHHWWMKVWGLEDWHQCLKLFAKSPCIACALKIRSNSKEQSLVELMSWAVQYTLILFQEQRERHSSLGEAGAEQRLFWYYLHFHSTGDLTLHMPGTEHIQSPSLLSL